MFFDERRGWRKAGGKGRFHHRHPGLDPRSACLEGKGGSRVKPGMTKGGAVSASHPKADIAPPPKTAFPHYSDMFQTGRWNALPHPPPRRDSSALASPSIPFRSSAAAPTAGHRKRRNASSARTARGGELWGGVGPGDLDGEDAAVRLCDGRHYHGADIARRRDRRHRPPRHEYRAVRARRKWGAA